MKMKLFAREETPVALRVARVAETQHGVVTTRQLNSCGVYPRAITRWVRSGKLFRVHHGVFSVGYRPTGQYAIEMAALLATGPRSAFSHQTAARYLGFWKRGTLDEISIIVPSARKSPSGVRLRRSNTITPEEICELGPFRVTSPIRTLLDLGDCISPFHLANLIHEAEYKMDVGIDASEAVIERNRNRRACSVFRQALELYLSGSAGTRSSLEDRFIRLLDRHGVKTPMVNTMVQCENTEFEVDFLWPHPKLIVEVDGPGHQRQPNRLMDGHRDRQLENAGYRVIRITSKDMQRRAGRAVVSTINRLVNA